jgi:hypothetical protein
MNHDGALCGSIPLTTVSLRATYCHHHQAWEMAWSMYSEDGERLVEHVPYTEVSFGPFDDLTDVFRALNRAAIDCLRAAPDL